MSRSQAMTVANTAALVTARAGVKKRASMIRSFGCCILILPQRDQGVKPCACAHVQIQPCAPAHLD